MKFRNDGHLVLSVWIVLVCVLSIAAQDRVKLRLRDEKSAKLKSREIQRTSDKFSPSKISDPFLADFLPYDTYQEDTVRERRKSSKIDDGERYIDSYRDFVLKNFGDVFSEKYQYNPDKADYSSPAEDQEEQEDDTSTEVEADPEATDDDKEDEDGFSFRASDEYERIRAQSQQQAKEIQESPGNCKIVQKDDMQCNVCYNAKTGDKSESCSYASEPESQQYAYVREKNYNSKDAEKPVQEEVAAEEKNEDDEEEDERKEPLEPIQRERITVKPKKKPRRKTAVYKRPIKSVSGKHYPAESRIEHEIIGPILIHSQTRKPVKFEKLVAPRNDEYEPGPFLERLTAASEAAANNATNDFTGGDNDDIDRFYSEPQGTDVDKALDEFSKKDWNGCTKKVKNELTCYLCKSASGMNHEECMYISESRPKSVKVKPTGRKKKSEKLQAAPSNYYNPEKRQFLKEKAPKKYSTITMKIPRVVRKFGEKSDTKEPKEKSAPENTERRTVKRTVSYKIQENGFADDPGRAMHYEHFVNHFDRR